MNLIFFGTPEFSVPSLEALCEAGQRVSLVVTRPDRPQGRGRRVMAPPVKRAALRRGLPLIQPDAAGSAEALARLREADADLGIVVAYWDGSPLSEKVLLLPKEGFVNLHASLLPRYRGAAPINRAIMAGETETGVTVQRMALRVDAGPILARKALAIEPDETAGELHDRLMVAGAELLADVVARLGLGEVFSEHEQDEREACRAPRITGKHLHIDWTQHAGAIKNHVRGLAPRPGAHCEFSGSRRRQRVTLLRVEALAQAPGGGACEPGTVLSVGEREGIAVQAGEGVVLIREVKPASGRAMSAADFGHGRKVCPGDRFC